MKAVIVVDVQNEFTTAGQRPVPGIEQAVTAIQERVQQVRSKGHAIVWIRHFNRPDESPAFMPETWGSEFISGFGPLAGAPNEVEMQKDVYGAFTGTAIGEWLRSREISDILIMGFYAHMCVSTTSREALMAGLNVYVDPRGTGSCAIQHDIIGYLTAEESKKAALLHIVNMGVQLLRPESDF